MATLAGSSITYLPYTPPPAPTTPMPGYPIPVPVTVGTHVAGASCGCGDTHAAATPAPGVSGASLEPPRFMQAAMEFQTPAGFVTPPATGGLDMFANWQADWWKYIVGAVLGRMLFGK